MPGATSGRPGGAAGVVGSSRAAGCPRRKRARDGPREPPSRPMRRVLGGVRHFRTFLPTCCASSCLQSLRANRRARLQHAQPSICSAAAFRSTAHSPLRRLGRFRATATRLPPVEGRPNLSECTRLRAASGILAARPLVHSLWKPPERSRNALGRSAGNLSEDARRSTQERPRSEQLQHPREGPTARRATQSVRYLKRPGD